MDNIYLPGDDEIDICTALNGSGPAYIFLIIEALVQAAVSRSIDQDVAHHLVTQTVLGAATHAMESQTSVEELRDNVTSPGGTTEAAIAALRAAGPSPSTKTSHDSITIGACQQGMYDEHDAPNLWPKSACH